MVPELTMPHVGAAIAGFIFVEVECMISFRGEGGERTSTSDEHTAILNDIAIVQECKERLVDMKNYSFPTLICSDISI